MKTSEKMTSKKTQIVKTQQRIDELNALLPQEELKNDEFIIETFLGTFYKNKKDLEALALIFRTYIDALAAVAFLRGVIKESGIIMTDEQFMDCVEYANEKGNHIVLLIFREALLRQTSKVFNNKIPATKICTTTFELMNKVVIKIIEKGERCLYVNTEDSTEYIKEIRKVKIFAK